MVKAGRKREDEQEDELFLPVRAGFGNGLLQSRAAAAAATSLGCCRVELLLRAAVPWRRGAAPAHPQGLQGISRLKHWAPVPCSLPCLQASGSWDAAPLWQRPGFLATNAAGLVWVVAFVGAGLVSPRLQRVRRWLRRRLPLLQRALRSPHTCFMHARRRHRTAGLRPAHQRRALPRQRPDGPARLRRSLGGRCHHPLACMLLAGLHPRRVGGQAGRQLGRWAVAGGPRGRSQASPG